MITKETSSPLDSSAKYGDTPILLQQPLEVVESSSTNSNHNNSTTNATDHLNMNEIKEKSSNRNDSITKRQLIGLDDEDGEDHDEGGGKDEEDQGVAIGGDDDEDDDRPSRSDLVQLPVSEMPPLPIDDTKESPTKASSSMKFEWPLLFERASKNWWHPQFDSHILEQQYWKSLLPRTTKRFQFGLFYLALMSGVYCVYFGVMGISERLTFFLIFLLVFVSVISILLVTFLKRFFYQNHCFKISLVLSLVLCSASLIATATLSSAVQMVSPAGLFSIYLEVLLLLYTVVPLPLYGTLIIGVIYSLLFEILLCFAISDRLTISNFVINLLLHICIHVIGIHILITIQVRMRDTFLKVGQSLIVKKQLGAEKDLKEKMIHSVMPLKVADWLMTGQSEDNDDDNKPGGVHRHAGNSKGGANGEDLDNASKAENNSDADVDSNSDDDDDDKSYNQDLHYGDHPYPAGPALKKMSTPRSSNQGDIRSIFRPFNMNTMNDVSILFADIVGFTKMSSNKTASQLVGLLNDLFGRFDNLCTQSGCEKISTLGDCYYCVSGCPEAAPDHARNCVEMGLAMISAIKDFDEDRHESVNMRVGIHTGTVLCGIVGKTRFKFDVWSNDVTLANQMESTGRPGMVHISEKTYGFLKNDYLVEEGDVVGDFKTYFICGRVAPDINPIKTRPEGPNPVTKTSTFILQTDLINEANQAQMAKSLPSLSSYLANNRHSALFGTDETVLDQVSTMVNHDGVIRVNSNRKKKGFFTSVEDAHDSDSIIPNGSKTNKFKSATQKYSMLPTYQKRKKANKQISVADRSLSRPTMQPQVSLPENGGNYKNLLNRRYSHSLPSLQSSREYCVIACANDGRELLNSAMNETSDYNNFNGGSETFPQGCDPKGHGPSNNNLRQLRLQSDQALINCVLEDTNHTTYFTSPPIHQLSLFFKNPKVEQDYRKHAWKGSKPAMKSEDEAAKTWSPAIFNAYFDVLVVVLVFSIISLDCFLSDGEYLTSSWIVYFCVAMLFLLTVIFVLAKNANVHLSKLQQPSDLFGLKPRKPLVRKIYSWCRGWIASHCLGSLLLALPMLAVFTNFNCQVTHHHYHHEEKNQRDFFLQLVFVSLAHFCNLSALNYCIKSMLATISAIVIVMLFSTWSCDPCTHQEKPIMMANLEGSTDAVASIVITSDRYQLFFMEVVTSISLLVVLVWLLNREFEISYRLSYHCSRLSARDRKKIQNLKNQADWLLHNIIPRHVADKLKRSANYSENHREVGIIFASIVNFNELYDEEYMGGKEYLRVLNELVSDFDEILQRPEFHNVEKIKTIGSTFMAASGMNPYIRQGNTHKYQHIHELVEFVFELQRSVNEFNQSLIEFDLVLRVGLNFGDVTAGVIGTTKLYYDIWGDAVNIASRMESTGVQGRIQVPERCMHVLSEWYTFELRGSIFVKGKDNMTTFLLVGRKPDSMVNAVTSIKPVLS